MRQKKRKRLRKAEQFASSNSRIPITPDHSIFYSTKDKQFKMRIYEAENDDYNTFGSPSSPPLTTSSISSDENESAKSCQKTLHYKRKAKSYYSAQMLKQKCKL